MEYNFPELEHDSDFQKIIQRRVTELGRNLTSQEQHNIEHYYMLKKKRLKTVDPIISIVELAQRWTGATNDDLLSMEAMGSLHPYKKDRPSRCRPDGKREHWLLPTVLDVQYKEDGESYINEGAKGCFFLESEISRIEFVHPELRDTLEESIFPTKTPPAVVSYEELKECYANRQKAIDNFRAVRKKDLQMIDSLGEANAKKDRIIKAMQAEQPPHPADRTLLDLSDEELELIRLRGEHEELVKLRERLAFLEEATLTQAATIAEYFEPALNNPSQSAEERSATIAELEAQAAPTAQKGTVSKKSCLILCRAFAEKSGCKEGSRNNTNKARTAIEGIGFTMGDDTIRKIFQECWGLDPE